MTLRFLPCKNLSWEINNDSEVLNYKKIKKTIKALNEYRKRISKCSHQGHTGKER